MPWLLVVAYVDELASGLPSAAAYGIRSGVTGDVTTLALSLFVVPALLSMWVEPVLLLWAQRFARMPVVATAVCAMGASLVLAGFARDATVFGLAWVLYFPSSGVACGMAEASLMDSAPEGTADRRMTQWTLAGVLGDLAAPAIVWGATALGLGWRGAFLGTGLSLCGLSALALRALAVPGVVIPHDDRPPRFRESVALLLQSRALWPWLGAVVLCSLMDELLAALVGLHVHAQSRSSNEVVRLLLAFSLGGGCGLWWVDHLLRRWSARSLLVATCVGAAAAYAGWMVCPRGPFGWIAMAATGACAAAHYPLVSARAYAVLPGRGVLVAAAAQWVAALELWFPLAVGLVADHVGLRAALAVALLQPLGILLVVWRAFRGIP